MLYCSFLLASLIVLVHAQAPAKSCCVSYYGDSKSTCALCNLQSFECRPSHQQAGVSNTSQDCISFTYADETACKAACSGCTWIGTSGFNGMGCPATITSYPPSPPPPPPSPPSSPADDFALVDISSTISTDFKFSGAATASNGKIVFAPLHADGVGVFDPTDNSFALVDISSTISTDDKFFGAATASNGKIIFAPFHSDVVGVFDPTDNSFALVDISSTISTDFKFSGAATASNGKIVFAPLHADGVGVFQAVHPCDASTAPTNGGVGDCTNSLASGSTCQPECDSGYTVSGTSSCSSFGTLTAATCTLSPAPSSGTLSPTPSLLIVLLATFACALFL